MRFSPSQICVGITLLLVASHAADANNRRDLPKSATARSSDDWQSIDRAGLHFIERNQPAVDFFQGALLGNGGLGVVVTTRPDAVVIHFGHNDVWDIRLAEDNREKLGTFEELFRRVRQIPADRSPESEPWLREYIEMAGANYRKPYPRPFPCGTLLLGFDRRQAELLGHRLHIDSGLCEVRFLIGGKLSVLEIFADLTADRLWLRMADETGRPCGAPFERLRLIPDPEAAGTMPRFSVGTNSPPHTVSFRQTLPFLEPARYNATNGHPRDQALRLSVRLADDLARLEAPAKRSDLQRRLGSNLDFVACAELDHGLAREISNESAVIPAPSSATFSAAARASRERWHEYWARSGVKLDDAELERVWYRNLYFLRCSATPGVTCPGLFGNWSYRGIGTAWHGDYHANYNMQQPFWGAFSSNHLEQHEPYVDLVHFLLPVSRKWARDYYQLDGAFFPHSAYPVEMNMLPYPVPTWGWEICETPWTVQSLWWHYLYSMDRELLRRRAFPPIREAARFLAAYMLRPEARGPAWGDDRYHIFPTVAPELHGLSPGLRLNRDCLVDLTLTKFIFRAFLRACAVLQLETQEKDTIQSVRDILEHFPPYPTAQTPAGPVFVSVPGEDPETVYNVPNSLMTVFPGEDHGLHSTAEELKTLANTWKKHRNEGGNELVFLNLQAARLGVLDLEKFKRQIAYCTQPNGTCADMALQVHGRYDDHTPFDYMTRMGVWFENFSLPVVINECLLQSYNGELRFFPNWPKDRSASFKTLRTVGAFLVSAEITSGEVRWIDITSEAGGPLRIINPWSDPVRVLRPSDEVTMQGSLLELDTTPGERIEFRRR